MAPRETLGETSEGEDAAAPREHGGNLDAAIARFGGEAGAWIDLSTGINRLPWPHPGPLPDVSSAATQALPTDTAARAAEDAARAGYAVAPGAGCLALSGAQAAIQLIPRLRAPGRAAILGPTYNEHRAAFAAEGWQAEEVETAEALAGAEAAVVVNPNNPDGRVHAPEDLLALAGRVGLLVVDESFGDLAPTRSLCPAAGRPGLVILRSLGKFYGLAGLRLGFAVGAPAEIAALRSRAGPWAVSGPALELGARALADDVWAADTRRRLAGDAARLDALAAAAGLAPVGGTGLFRLYDTAPTGQEAAGWQEHLARARIWARRFGYAPTWLRVGLPGGDGEWARLASALRQAPQRARR